MVAKPEVAVWGMEDSMTAMVATVDSLDPKTLLMALRQLRKGDFSVRLPLDLTGVDGEIAAAFNDVVELNQNLTAETSRLSVAIGKEGRISQRAKLSNASGGWETCVDSINALVGDMIQPTTEIARVIGAVAKGDLSKTMALEIEGRPLQGEFLRTARDVNTMVEQLVTVTTELTRVAREVGTEGKLGGQAQVKGVAGTWKDLTDNVNMMAANLTGQVRNIAEVTTAVAKGDLSKKITVDVKGEILELKSTINTMVDQLNSFASEVTRVAREVGSEGKLGGQAKVEGVGGTWKDLTDSVNMMAANLTGQVRNIADVTTAVANGDLSKKITVDVKGEILELKSTVNTMVDQLNSFASEVTRVAREVGSEGKLGGQAQVKGVGGTWKDLTDNVNAMAANLTGQVRNIADVTTAVANGDLSKKITVPVKGEILELKNTINTMVDQLNSFASEVTRVAREVGSEGKLGGQAQVKGVGGTWKDLTDSVNAMATNLTGQVRNIAEVTTAVANGDLSKKITVDVKGEILELKSTINTMVDQLNSFASEVTRVAREVGSEGKLGGQAQVKGVAGTWKDLTDNVNAMATNLTGQVRNIAEVTTAVANGDLSKKITVDVKGEILELKSTINTMVDQLNSFASEVVRVAREVGIEGKLGGQAQVKGVAGTWKDLTDNVNMMAANLTGQVRNIAEVTTAVAKGDLSKKITVDVKGEIFELKSTINTMVDQLNSFASEVTRVAREVGSEGKLGGQAKVEGVGGTWKDLTDNVNMMAANLTGQVRGIASVVTAVADGDLKRKLAVDAKGEIAALASTINGMIDTLATFADQVTNVAREVGIEGKLGGQARVPGAAGLWKDLTENVNQLAANLTTQVRAIAEVATAVTKGDLTRSITVEAMGEVAALKDNINEMIRNLRDTTQKNAEQDWLKTNLAKFTRMLQGERDLVTVSNMILSEIAPLVNAQHGVFYVATRERDDALLELVASYALKERKNLSNRFQLKEGLVGQCAYEKKRILLTNVPRDYVAISSGLGEAPPLNIIVLPVLFEDEVKAVIELASFNRFSETHQSFLEQLTESIGIVLNTIAANMRTEGLLKQSQRLTRELQSQQEELTATNGRLEQQAASLRKSEELLKAQQEKLTTTNEALEEKAEQLEQQNIEVERKNREVVLAKAALEEKAEQLALTSKYKSQFLANMSHELRTPLNSLLILSKLLADNAGSNLSDRQVEFARTIHAAGSDLLGLINDILDLSKIESGTVTLEVGEVVLADLRSHVERTFTQMAQEKGLALTIEMDESLPPAMQTDEKRLSQVLNNLLSNAFKFTEAGGITFQVRPVSDGWSAGHPTLGAAPMVLAFTVTDTGIGIPEDKQRIIFEAFQQADGTTSRKYGGTGLGLSISREIARLLGGEIRVSSVVGEGSSFTLYVPRVHDAFAVASGQLAAPAALIAHRPAEDASLQEPAGQPDLLPSGEDREQPSSGEPVVLIVEDDPTFASILMDLAREKGFRTLLSTGGAAALPLARKHRPDAVLLDIGLPDMDGWAVLDLLKRDPQTGHIPVHVISAKDERRRGLAMGAFDYSEKPVEREAIFDALNRVRSFRDRTHRKLLVVEKDSRQPGAVAALVGNGDVETLTVTSTEAATAALAADRFDCMVLDLSSPTLAGPTAEDFELVEWLRSRDAISWMPVVVYISAEIAPEDEARLRRLAETVVLKSTRSPAALLDETALFLHRAIDRLPEDKRLSILDLRRHDPSLAGRRVLVIDDDIRNIFSLASVMESHSIEVLHAESGREGIERLRADPAIDVVLVDIMMPEMDGYETMRRIRGIEEFRTLPMIAVTAKAMKGDRDKCIEAGATDYIAKPVDIDHLLSLLRIWTARSGRQLSRTGMPA
ncbi:hybrid sensor histidine kinase/response regulator [Azospirillum picis]|uniref:histidine kinase n=1 Tax=Azospirillum picis TaxID=488438 RepID=A0ABU0MM61_9PROT|nr:HAMP domain-containing protein [Azospirillum picis]MDQ0534439.1 HAMP domain-containing protein/signal transduction histidine kinase/CheY-like chemotaxis protein [Azospirillum picis]